ncbi:hypothetical protein WDU94_005812, partial [Cyamophila willieti]
FDFSFTTDILKRLDKIDRSIINLTECYQKIKGDIKQCLVALKSNRGQHPQEEVEDEDAEEVSLQGTFPVHSLDDLLDVENKLKDDEKFKTAVLTQFQKLKGLDMRQTCIGLMRHTISNQVAGDLAWSGSKDKLAFKDFKIFSQMIIDTCIRLHGALQVHVLKIIKNWLKNANRRVGE